MKTIVREGDKKVMLDTENDRLVWSGKDNYLGQGSPTRWASLFVRERKDGPAIFYWAHYTMWQGERNYIEQLSLKEAQQYAEEHFGELRVDDPEVLKSWGLVYLDKVE